MKNFLKGLLDFLVVIIIVSLVVLAVSGGNHNKRPCDCGDICIKAAVPCGFKDCPSGKR